MAISITHSYQAVGANDPAKEVSSTRWNAALTTSMATARLLGRTTAGVGAFEEISVGTGLSYAATSLSFDQTYGDGRYARLAASNFFTADQQSYSTTSSFYLVRIQGSTAGDFGSGFKLFTKADNTVDDLGLSTTKGWVFFARSNATTVTKPNAIFFTYWSGSAYTNVLAMDPNTSMLELNWGFTANTDFKAKGDITVEKNDARVQLVRPTGFTNTYQGIGFYDNITWRGGIYYNMTTNRHIVFENSSGTEQNIWHTGVLSKPVSVITLGGAPTGSDIPSGEARVVKRTDTGAVTLHYNDAGTLKSVTLT